MNFIYWQDPRAGGEFYCWLKGQEDARGYGQTKETALADLVSRHGSRIGVSFEKSPTLPEVERRARASTSSIQREEWDHWQ